MDEELISVILPVYNVGDYLEESLNTIVKQSYSNIEIVLIDDGSSDNSGEICDRFAKQDRRIVVRHQSNRGLVASWKAALTIAKGKWIAFVDPDDYVGIDYLADMYSATDSSVDMVIAPIKKIIRDKITRVEGNLKPGIYAGDAYRKNVLEHLLSNGRFQSRLLPPNRWGKLIRKVDLVKNLKYIDNSVTYGEDLNIMFPIFVDINSIVLLEEDINNCYFYRIRETSMINNYDKNRWESVKKVYKSLNKVLLDKQETIPFDTMYRQLVLDCSAAFVQSYKNEFKNSQFKLVVLNRLICDMRHQDMYEDIKHERYPKYSPLQKMILFDIVGGNKLTHCIMYHLLKIGIAFKKRRI